MEKQELFDALKLLTDSYLDITHQLKGFQMDSTRAFELLLKQTEEVQNYAMKLTNQSIKQLDKAQMIYASGLPNDHLALIYHECSQGEFKERLQKDTGHNNLINNFCLIMLYEYWEDIRCRIASIQNLETNSVKSDLFGDLRHIRHDIVHNKGIASNQYSVQNKLLKWFNTNDSINITEERFNFIVENIFDFFNDYIEHLTGMKPYSDKSLSIKGKNRQMFMINSGTVTIK